MLKEIVAWIGHFIQPVPVPFCVFVSFQLKLSFFPWSTCNAMHRMQWADSWWFVLCIILCLHRHSNMFGAVVLYPFGAKVVADGHSHSFTCLWLRWHGRKVRPVGFGKQRKELSWVLVCSFCCPSLRRGNHRIRLRPCYSRTRYYYPHYLLKLVPV